MSNYRRKTDTLPTCMNCGAVLYGAYCSQCGQKSAEPITWSRALSTARRRLRTFDSRWLRTAAALTVDPGRMIRRYLRGRRLPYASPLAYALATVSFCVVLVIGLEVELTAPGTPWSFPAASATLSDVPEAGSTEPVGAGGQEPDSQPQERSLAYTVFALSAASSLLVGVATALLQTKLYASHDFTWAETYAFTLFVLGQLALHQALFALLGALASTVGLTALAVVLVLYLAFALSGFYRRGLFASLPAAALLSTVQVAGIFVMGSVARILLRA